MSFESRNTAKSTSQPRTGKGSPSLLRGRMAVVLGAATGLVLCAVALGAFLLFGGQGAAPQGTAQAVCADLEAQDYNGLYATLSAHLQTEGTQNQFAASQQYLDAQGGKVTNCSYAVQHADGAQAAITLTITRARVGASPGMIHLLYQNASWRVDAYDDTLI